MSAICVVGMKLDEPSAVGGGASPAFLEYMEDDDEKRWYGLRLVRTVVGDRGRKNGVLVVVCRPREEIVSRVSSVLGD